MKTGPRLAHRFVVALPQLRRELRGVVFLHLIAVAILMLPIQSHISVINRERADMGTWAGRSFVLCGRGDNLFSKLQLIRNRKRLKT